MLDNSVIRILNYVAANVRWSGPNVSVIQEVERLAVEDSAQYANSHMKDALYFKTKESLWDFVFEKMEYTGLFAEFGVHKGYSINYFAKKICRESKVIYGFDSFEGLKEDWKGANLKKGTFNVGGSMPKVEPNVTLTKGWFDASVPIFLSQNKEHFSFIHIDSDTYEAARTLLQLLGDRIHSGCFIIFDEYFGYRGWREGEYKAWQEFVRGRGINYEYLGFSHIQVAVRVV